ncbi:hypothetical protein SK3146_06386 [Paenibacillus konkukensis]|uniref:Uncharacterized protein n=1 Tax=Paenibacillus konkukensis TaxID=2020716 RepID=A0ABY4RXZ3_9BACL|nr:hypothetical protein SK3146_06386 [Paenibacillus konkukensis]
MNDVEGIYMKYTVIIHSLCTKGTPSDRLLGLHQKRRELSQQSRAFSF